MILGGRVVGYLSAHRPYQVVLLSIYTSLYTSFERDMHITYTIYHSLVCGFVFLASSFQVFPCIHFDGLLSVIGRSFAGVSEVYPMALPTETVANLYGFSCFGLFRYPISPS